MNLRKVTRPVIICGGGVGGLTLANCLKVSKIPFILLESAPEFKEVGGGIGLWGPALKALRAIDLEEKLVPQGKMMVSAGYRLSCDIDKGEWLVKPSSILRRHTSCLTLKRADLMSELFNGLNEKDEYSVKSGESPASIRFGATLSEFTDHYDYVRITLDNGETLEGSFLIGADGIHSKVRTGLFPEVKPTHSGYHYWQGITKLDDLMVEEGYKMDDLDLPAFEAWHPGMRFGVVALNYPYIFWFLASDENISQGDVSTKEGLIKKCAPFGKKICHMIESTDERMIHKHDLRDIRKMEKWTKGRVALLGDAVHAMAPNLAQGAVLAIEDALQLGHQIYKIYDFLEKEDLNSERKKSLLQESLEEYERIRKKRVFRVQNLVPWVHKVGSTDSLAHVRNFIFKTSPKCISTPIFDFTHRWSLGMRYTAPNIGQGLYYRLLGHSFMTMNPIFFKFHTFDKERYISGTVSVRRGKGLGGLIAWLMRLPKPVQNGFVELRVFSDKCGRERWYRNFRDENKKLLSIFNTTQNLFEEDLLEYYKIFYFIFEAKVKEGENDRFYFNLKESGIRLTRNRRLKFPKFISPVVNAVTIATEKGWKFETNIKSSKLLDSIVGEILSYKGDVQI